ncbi:MAG: hypothetical protein M0P64_01060 [Candidatus Pacebacteria bacterium]|jgi:hypothetical protein|nr:hypothetical protein [Candidatus Paceibacterota bacterium]
MTSLNDDLLMDESGEIDASSFSTDDDFRKEDADASLRALEGEGISIVEEETFSTLSRGEEGSRDRFSQDLFKEEGIEILSDEE